MTSIGFAVLLIVVAGASGGRASAQPREPTASPSDLRDAEAVWRGYVQCEITRKFKPCYPLLSSRVRDLWNQQDRATESQYADTKGAEEVRLITIRISHSRGTRLKVTVLSRARGEGEGGLFQEDRAYTPVREGAVWKVDGITVGAQEYLP